MDAGEIIDMLSQDQPIEGIGLFPRDQVREVLKKYFPDIQDCEFELTWEGDGSYFQISFGHGTEKHIHLIVANCGYELVKTQNAINRLIEACTSLGCALYDPQTGERYVQPEPKETG
jgi:hypothetical protein